MSAGPGARAERNLFHVFDLHARAAGGEHGAEGNGTGAIDRVDADVLAGHIFAGLAGLAGADDPIRIGHSI